MLSLSEALIPRWQHDAPGLCPLGKYPVTIEILLKTGLK